MMTSAYLNALAAIAVAISAATLLLLTVAMLFQLPTADGTRRRILVDRLLGNVRTLTFLALIGWIGARLGASTPRIGMPEGVLEDIQRRLTATDTQHVTMLQAWERIETVVTERCGAPSARSAARHVLRPITGFPLGDACATPTIGPPNPGRELACRTVDEQIKGIRREMRDQGTNVAGIQLVGSFDRRPFRGLDAEENVRLAARRAEYVRGRLAGPTSDFPIWTAIRGPSVYTPPPAQQPNDGFEADRSVEVVFLMRAPGESDK